MLTIVMKASIQALSKEIIAEIDKQILVPRSKQT